MKASIVIKNGKLMTMDSQRPEADWIAIGEDRILSVGDGEEYSGYIDCDTRIIDADGATVVPGFIDSHFHTVITALSESRISLEGARNFKEVGKRLKAARSKAKSKDKMIVATKLDCDKLEEGRFPDRTVLDKYCRDIPVAVYTTDYHALMLNTCGILYFRAPFTLNGVDIDENGMPTGIFTAQAGARLEANIREAVSDSELELALETVMPKLFAHGLTTVAAMEGGNMNFGFGEDYDCEYIYQNRCKYPLDMELFYPTTDIEIVESKGLKRIGGALYLDGTLGRRTAALSTDYCDAPGTRGLLYVEPDSLREFVVACYEKNLQLALDIIGDAAIEEALCAFEYAQRLYGKKQLRNRIEHCEMMRVDQMKRAAELGIIVSVQPTYEGCWGGSGSMYHRRLGARYRETNQFRSMIDSGLVVCGGSDSDVTDLNPLVGIHYAVNHPVAAHRVSLSEAVAMYTRNGAYGLFLENEVGSLTPGKKADVVILEKDLQTLNPKKIKDVKVSLTVKQGKVLHNRGFHAET